MSGEDHANRAQSSIGLVRPKRWLLRTAFVPWTFALVGAVMAVTSGAILFFLLARIAESSDADEAEIVAALEQLGEEAKRASR
jgi:hypothetical protein